MHVTNKEPHQLLAQSLRERIKKDFNFCQFYLSPDLPGFDIRLSAKKYGYSESEALEYRNQLIKCGLWSKESEGKIKIRDQFLDLGDISTLDHMTAAMNILGHLSEEGPCWYESFLVVTNEEIKKEFYKSLNQLIRKFVEKSQTVNGDRIVAWSHEALDLYSKEKSNA